MVLVEKDEPKSYIYIYFLIRKINGCMGLIRIDVKHKFRNLYILM